MNHIFVNLKRFDVPRSAGGLADAMDPAEWIETILEKTVQLGLGKLPTARLIYLVPEGLLIPAVKKWKTIAGEEANHLSIGVQGVHWQNVEPDGNFGAFTSLLPAAAARNMGAQWTIIGHSEERRAKAQLLEAFNNQAGGKKSQYLSETINRMIRKEVDCALQSDLSVLLCIGESAEERGEGSFEEQKQRIGEVLRQQLLTNLETLRDRPTEKAIVVGYEPIWAIGPGKTPPGREYISYVSSLIKDVARDELGIDDLPVVYGGGLKKENAPMLATIESIDGGLVALTQFTGKIGFSVYGLKEIVDHYLQQR